MSVQQYDPITGQPITVEDQPNANTANPATPVSQPTNNNIKPIIPGSIPTIGNGAQPAAGNNAAAPNLGQPIISGAQSAAGNTGSAPAFGQPVIPGAQPAAGNNTAAPNLGQPIIPGAQSAAGNTGSAPAFGQPAMSGASSGTPGITFGNGSAPGGNNTKKIIIAACIAVAVLIILAVVAFMNHGGKDESDNKLPIAPSGSSESVDDSGSEASDSSEIASTVATTESDSTAAATTAPETGNQNAGQNTEADKLYSFTVNDVTYQLPIKVSEFIDNGWVCKDSEDLNEILASEQEIYVDFYIIGTDRSYVSVYIKNFSVDAQPASDGYITEISLYGSSFERSDATLSVHDGDITFGSTKEDVLAVYGEPYYTNEASTSTVLKYNTSNSDRDYNNISFWIDNESGVLNYITIENDTEPADFVQAEVNTDVPSFVSEYTAPSSLGDDILSGNVEIDGTLYNIPAPMQAFLDAGWTLEDNAGSVIGAGQIYSLALYKGDNYIYIEVCNPSTSALYIENTMVSSVTFYTQRYNSNVEIKLPGDITNATTKDEFKSYIDSKGLNYITDESWKSYKVPMDQTDTSSYPSNKIVYEYSDDGSMYQLELTNNTWDK